MSRSYSCGNLFSGSCDSDRVGARFEPWCYSQSSVHGDPHVIEWQKFGHYSGVWTGCRGRDVDAAWVSSDTGDTSSFFVFLVLLHRDFFCRWSRLSTVAWWLTNDAVAAAVTCGHDCTCAVVVAVVLGSYFPVAAAGHARDGDDDGCCL